MGDSPVGGDRDRRLDVRRRDVDIVPGKAYLLTPLELTSGYRRKGGLAISHPFHVTVGWKIPTSHLIGSSRARHMSTPKPRDIKIPATHMGPARAT